jgi:hypothetical protein
VKKISDCELWNMEKAHVSSESGIAMANTEQNRFMPPPHRMPRRNRAQLESRMEANTFDKLKPYTLSAEDRSHFKQCHIKMVAEEISAQSAQSRPGTTNLNEEVLRQVADLLDCRETDCNQN